MTEQNQLGNTLWRIADQLRGAMDADDFRVPLVHGYKNGLNDLNDLITAETQTLDALKTHSLMQQLFPSAEAMAA